MSDRLPALLSAGQIAPDPTWRMPAHFHSCHELIVILSGSMLLKTGREEICAEHGTALFYHAGMVHEEISQKADPVSSLFVGFTSGEVLSSIPLVMQDSNGRLRQLLSWLVIDAKSGRNPKEFGVLLAAVIAEMRHLSEHPQDPWLEEVRSYMQKNYTEELRLADLANGMRMDRFSFARKFKRLGGCTAMEQLRRIRLNEARNMILTSGLPLKVIAPACGLGDEYQLSKLFRRYFGLSPGGMRAWPKKRPR